MFNTDHFKTLGVDLSVKPDALKQAYEYKKNALTLAILSDDEKATQLQAIEEAYRVLNNETRRKLYHVELAIGNSTIAMAPDGFFTPWKNVKDVGYSVISFIGLPVYLGLMGSICAVTTGLVVLLSPFSCCIDNEKNDNPGIWEMLSTLTVFTAAAIALAIIAPIVVAASALTRTLTTVATYLFEHAKEIGESCQSLGMGMGGVVPIGGII